MAVVLNAPAAIRFMAVASPDRHLQAARALGADISGARPENAGRILSDRIIDFMKRLDIPNGLSAIGYSRDDIPRFVEGTLPQHRVLKLSPRPVDADELATVFADAMSYW
jgi:hydroxyacid-oxoacid transhydrogenase